jgi:phosphomannomutase/phosphoglucomutase
MEISKSIFRDYDIRGIYPDQINEKIIKRIAKAISVKCLNEGVSEICVARDGRLSGKKLLSTLENALSENGINVINTGLATTPLLYFAAKKSKYKSGVMITGSHNPKNYNGIKLIINDKPVSGVEIYNLINQSLDISENNGKIISKDFKEEYISEIKKNISINEKLKVVIDCGNGASGCIAPKLYKALGCEVVNLYTDVDGNFPNHHPDPGKPENLTDLIKKVKETKADLGLAFDGDGDRVGVVTNDGKIVFPDKILMILSKDILATKKGTIIFDVKCTDSLPKLIKENGGNPIMYPTGHFNIKNGIKEHNPLLAGEMSGHIFFNDKWYGFDDGIYSGARIIELILKNRKSISSLNKELPELFSTNELNIEVSDESKFEIVKKFIAQCSLDGDKILIDGLRINFKNGWGLLRASNTTPMLVLRFEGDTEENLIQIKNKFIKELARICPDIDINLN